jgi:UDP-N-acetylglucosamine 2-epimerase (non-hydrolysing)
MGTRPEAIKLAPVVLSAQKSGAFDVKVIRTSQHREMLDQMVEHFELSIDEDLDIMKPDQSLADITTNALSGLYKTFQEMKPDCVIVQGDTTTTFASSLAAFHRRVPVAHVEAGLRSFDRAQPFPEEVNRRLTTVLADLHLAPTPLAKERLLAEGVAPERIAVTGNTVVDALAQIVAAATASEAAPIVALPADARVVLATIHRRESWGAELAGVCQALGRLVDRFADLHVVLPVHLNPNVREPVHRSLGGRDRVHLLPPVDYLQFVRLLQRATLVVTDSGGVQEEAPSLGKPLLLLRRVTERPEAFDAGAALLVGTDPDRIVAEASRLLEDPDAYRAMTGVPNPYGDGRAAGRVVEAIQRFLAGEVPVLEASREFRPGSPAQG